MTRSAEKFLNSRAVSTDRIRRSGFLPTSEHGFGIGNVLRPDHVSAALRPTTDGIMSAWSFEIGRNCDIGRIRNFLDTLGIVASVLSRFQVSENESGLSKLRFLVNTFASLLRVFGTRFPYESVPRCNTGDIPESLFSNVRQTSERSPDIPPVSSD
jgi:hypothetical protein